MAPPSHRPLYTIQRTAGDWYPILFSMAIVCTSFTTPYTSATTNWTLLHSRQPHTSRTACHSAPSVRSPHSSHTRASSRARLSCAVIRAVAGASVVSCCSSRPDSGIHTFDILSIYHNATHLGKRNISNGSLIGAGEYCTHLWVST